MALSCTIERGKTYFYSDKPQSALCIFGMLGVAAVHNMYQVPQSPQPVVIIRNTHVKNTISCNL